MQFKTPQLLYFTLCMGHVWAIKFSVVDHMTSQRFIEALASLSAIIVCIIQTKIMKKLELEYCNNNKGKDNDEHVL